MKVTIYTIPFCGRCSVAKALLKRKGIAFEEKHAKELTLDIAELPLANIDGEWFEGLEKIKERIK